MTATNPIVGELIHRIAQRDEEAFGQLYDCMKSLLASQIRRVVNDQEKTEEVLQDVFVYIWLRAEAYRHDRGCPLAWLYTLARSRALDRWRRDRRERMTSELNDEILPTRISETVRRPSEVWRHAQIRRGLGSLPQAQQELVRLAYFEGYTHVEIAESTGIPLGTVKARLRRGLENLRESLMEPAFRRAA